MKNFIYIGGTPVEEPCAQMGHTPDYAKFNRLECKAYIAALKKKYGEPPEGAEFSIKTEAHDFGNYREVVVRYEDNEAASKYACRCENGLSTWQEVRMWPPVTYDGSTPVLVLEEETLWDMDSNPLCMPTVEQRDRAKPEADDALSRLLLACAKPDLEAVWQAVEDLEHLTTRPNPVLPNARRVVTQLLVQGYLDDGK